jgi:hypothetical protein
LERRLQFIHIGKCGGSTISELLSSSEVVKNQYTLFFESHINGVEISSSCDYLICLRNPIARAFSAFEWRKKLVLDDACFDQVNRFPGEKRVLKKYQSLQVLAHSLYRHNGELDQSVARDFGLIHHLRESISFYLTPLLPVLNPKNILGVICQETLAADSRDLLGVDASRLFVRRNINKRSKHAHLDQLAVSNLRRFLSKDYQCISALWALGALEDQRFFRVMSDAV